MRSYEQFRDAIVAGRAEQAAAMRSNGQIEQEISDRLHNIGKIDLTLAEDNGVDLGFLCGLDVKRLSSDSQYYEDVKGRLTGALERIGRLLEDVLC